MELLLIGLTVLMVGYSLFSAKLAEYAITMPMVFLTAGVLMSIKGFDLTHENAEIFHNLAEVTLALLLFADATQLRRKALEGFGALTARMLLIGLPVAIVVGTGVNALLLPDWPIWHWFLLAALLAPTDAALGQAVQTNENIPQILRDAMNAESGLNDGLALPFVIFFASLAVATSGESHGEVALIPLLSSQIGLGVLIGLAGGFAIGKLRNFVVERNYMAHGLARVATLALVGVIFFLAEQVGGNSFVAVFISGVAFANASKGDVAHARSFIESDGQFLAMISFFFIGALFVPVALDHAIPVYLLLIAVSLIVVRPLAIWISFIGSDTPANERLFFGWYGPRGLATALFAVFVVVDFEGLAMSDEILVVAVMAVVVSAFVHGISAKWASEVFGLKVDDTKSAK